MKASIILLVFMNLIFAQAENCSLVRVEATSATGAVSTGNGFAVSTSQIVANEHTIGDASQVKVVLSNGNTQNVAIALKDFHTDLVVLEVESKNSLTPCVLSEETVTHNTNASMVGFADQNLSTNRSLINVLNPASTSHEIPGISSTIEFAGSKDFNLGLRKSLSGSILKSTSGVIGIVAQLDRAGNGFAIPTSSIKEIIQTLHSGQRIDRKYRFSRRQNAFFFSGLKLIGSAQPQVVARGPHEGLVIDDEPLPPQEINVARGGGTPHDGIRRPRGGTPHDGKVDEFDRIYSPGDRTIMVNGALSGSRDGVIGTVVDLPQLASSQPQLARFARETQATEVVIKAIDGKQVSNLLGLVRELGICSRCLITDFAIVTVKQQTANNFFVKAIRNVYELEKSFGLNGSRSLSINARETLATIGQILIQMEDQVAVDKIVSNSKVTQLKQTWERFEQSIQNLFLNDRQIDLMFELRQAVLLAPRAGAQ